MSDLGVAALIKVFLPGPLRAQLRFTTYIFLLITFGTFLKESILFTALHAQTDIHNNKYGFKRPLTGRGGNDECALMGVYGFERLRASSLSRLERR